MEEPDMSYVGKAPCGCVKVAIADIPEHRKDMSNEVASALRAGLTIERVTSEWVRTESCWSCDVCRLAKQARMAV